MTHFLRVRDWQRQRHFKRVALLLLCLCLVPAAAAVANQRPNVLLICVDDLRPELNCFGVDYIQSPHIDALAARGISFQRHYVQAPTCGASRFALLTGRYGPYDNHALFKRARQLQKDPESAAPSMPAWFRQAGYATASVGKVSHHPGGFGGADWDDPKQIEMPLSWDSSLMPVGPWRHPRGAMHGLAEGQIRQVSSEMPVFQAKPGDDRLYPDGWIADEAISQLQDLAGHPEKPFFLAVGFIRPHLPFGAPQKYYDPYQDVELPPIAFPEKPAHRSTWINSGEFMQYNRWGRDPRVDAQFATEVRKHYAACVSYADAQVGRLLESLRQSGAAQNTIVVLWGDHGWHLGEHGVWGKHTLFEESLRAPLIIAFNSQFNPRKRNPGLPCQAIVESIDVFPTLCELTNIDPPQSAAGVSLTNMLGDISAPGHPAVSYTAKAETLRTDRYRLVAHRDGYTELYDHEADPHEQTNLAESEPELVQSLRQQLQAKITPPLD